MFGVGVQYYGERDVVIRSLRDDKTLTETYMAKREEKGERLTQSEMDRIKKKYRAYKKFGLDDVSANVLLSSGLSNDEKATYFVDKKLKDDESVSRYIYSEWASDALRESYNKLLKQERRKNQ
jgi:hypothetical protein